MLAALVMRGSINGVFGHASDVCLGINKRVKQEFAAIAAARGVEYNDPSTMDMSATDLVPLSETEGAGLASLYDRHWENRRPWGDRRLLALRTAFDKLIDIVSPTPQEWDGALSKLRACWPVDQGDVPHEHDVVHAAWELRNLAVSLGDNEATQRIERILKGWRDATEEPHLKRWCGEAIERNGPKPRRMFPLGFDDKNPDLWFAKRVFESRKK